VYNGSLRAGQRKPLAGAAGRRLQRENDVRECRTPSALESLVERIRLSEESGGEWALSSDEVCDLLGVEPTDFYRRIYAADREAHPLIGLHAAAELFSQENIWEFVALVELFCGRETERRLEEAGVFFSHPEQLEIMGTLVAAVSGAVRRHRVDEEQFSAMLRSFGSFDRARRCYLEEHFSLDGLIEAAVEQYCREREFRIPGLARKNARRLLGYFFQKHALEPGMLLAGASAVLFEQAVREGFAEAAETGSYRAGGAGAAQGERARSGSAAGRGSLTLERARRVMELDGRPFSSSELKRQYKRLMKRFHPDVNPGGLRRCQEINAAYALILSSA
jgi:hypothetical protein